ncbi:hypothetical protein FHX42_005297 [Saccharopolyspora lacisalsi]|uniref:Uncharacterized protein n=1 Tax=Halosaccharopolyspora lacisalsi TaxID=1000566 RepID=A0A839E4C6_9PSEU|nr:hypothetical protein [Halosaccharopolyspora lacisalsi]MBA8827890.1 hypothetical protein [Halosaccharopolyspora lacisalsi]
MTTTDPFCHCGHRESTHDAGQCWTHGDIRCTCAWFEPAWTPTKLHAHGTTGSAKQEHRVAMAIDEHIQANRNDPNLDAYDLAAAALEAMRADTGNHL